MHLSSYLVVKGKVTNTNYMLFEWERQFIFLIFSFFHFQTDQILTQEKLHLNKVFWFLKQHSNFY